MEKNSTPERYNERSPHPAYTYGDLYEAYVKYTSYLNKSLNVTKVVPFEKFESEILSRRNTLNGIQEKIYLWEYVEVICKMKRKHFMGILEEVREENPPWKQSLNHGLEDYE